MHVELNLSDRAMKTTCLCCGKSDAEFVIELRDGAFSGREIGLVRGAVSRRYRATVTVEVERRCGTGRSSSIARCSSTIPALAGPGDRARNPAEEAATGRQPWGDHADLSPERDAVFAELGTPEAPKRVPDGDDASRAGGAPGEARIDTGREPGDRNKIE